MSNRRILLTGATGFLGRQAIEPLRRRGWQVHALTSGATPTDEEGLLWHRHDLLTPGSAARAIDEIGPQAMLHLAWHVAASGAENFAWTRATLELLEAFEQGGGERAVGIGSCAEYDWTASQPLSEDSPLVPATPYGVAKHACAQAFLGLAAETGLSAAWGRVFFVYGPGEAPRRLVPAVIRALLAGEPARTTHGEQLRDYLFAPDLGEAMAALVDARTTGAINLASGTSIPLRALVEEAARQLGREELIELGAVEAHPDEAPEVSADVTRLLAEVAWQPRTSLTDGIARSIEWWRAEEAR